MKGEDTASRAKPGLEFKVQSVSAELHFGTTIVYGVTSYSIDSTTSWMSLKSSGSEPTAVAGTPRGSSRRRGNWHAEVAGSGVWIR
jgi:hypothetical protein